MYKKLGGNKKNKKTSKIRSHLLFSRDLYPKTFVLNLYQSQNHITMKQGIKVFSILIISLFIVNLANAQKGADMKRGGISGDPQSKTTVPSTEALSAKASIKPSNTCNTADLKKHLKNDQMVTLYDMSKKKSRDAIVKIDKDGKFTFDMKSAEHANRMAAKNRQSIEEKKKLKLQVQLSGKTKIMDKSDKELGTYKISVPLNGVMKITCK